MSDIIVWLAANRNSQLQPCCPQKFNLFTEKHAAVLLGSCMLFCMCRKGRGLFGVLLFRKELTFALCPVLFQP